MRISDWCSDVCSSDLLVAAWPVLPSLEAAPQKSSLPARAPFLLVAAPRRPLPTPATSAASAIGSLTYEALETPAPLEAQVGHYLPYRPSRIVIDGASGHPTPLVESVAMGRSEEHTSELQSLMRISYAVFCLETKKNKTT